MDEVLFLLFSILLGAVTCSPTPGVKYTLYGVQKTWNEARAICETQGQVMLKLDTSEKLTNFMVYLDLWLNMGVLEEDLWTGLHRHIINSSSTYNLEWYDCESLGQWMNWGNYEPDHQDWELCIRLGTSTETFNTRECNKAYQVVCQHNTVCSYEEFQHKTIVGANLTFTLDDTLDSCKQFCLDFSNGKDECVLVTYGGNLLGVCKIYTGSSVFVQNQPIMTDEEGTIVLIKKCVFGEYDSKAPSVEANTASDPITVCPASAETSSIPSSSLSTNIPLTASTLNLYIENIHQTHMTTENTDEQSQTFEESVSSVLELAQLLSPSKEYITPSDEQLGTSAASNIHSNTDSDVTEADVTESTPVHTTPPLQYDTDTPLSLISLSLLNNVHQSVPSLNTEPISDMTDLESIVGSSVMGSILPTLSTQGPRWTASEDIHSSAYFVLPDSAVTILSSSLENTELQTTLVYNVTTMTTNVQQNATNSYERPCPCFCAIKQQDASVNYKSLKILLDKRSLSSYWRSKNSAQDDRMSAKAIGSSGIVIIIVFLSFIVCMDLDKLARANRSWKNSSMGTVAHLDCTAVDNIKRTHL